MKNFRKDIYRTINENDTLPLFNFYYRGIFSNDDVIHEPLTNAWVDYIYEDGITYRQIIGGTEEGCQLVLANSIVNIQYVATCIP